MPTLIERLDSIMGRAVTYEEFELWKKKRSNARKRALHRYRSGDINHDELNAYYKLVDSAPLEVIGTLCRFGRPVMINTPLRLRLEANEARSVTDEEYNTWVKARKWRISRLHTLASAGVYTQDQKADIIKLLDSSNINSIHNIAVGVKVSSP